MVELRRPLAVAVDVVETVFSLDAMRAALADAGSGAPTVERFFARLLRDGFALAASGSYRPFRDVADEALVATSTGLDPGTRGRILGSFARLDPHPDARPALERLAEADVPVAALTNGSAALTEGLLRRAGLDPLVGRVIGIEEIQAWKPAPDSYRHAADVLGVVPGRLALAAVHSWDVHGARRAGLVTGWASRFEGWFPAIFERPDVVGSDLVEVVEGLLALPPGAPR